jgi:hypothetical protein
MDATVSAAMTTRHQYDSKDLTDIVDVINGRAHLATELDQAEAEVQEFVRKTFKVFFDDPNFYDSLSANLLPDAASQDRAELIMERIRFMAHG